MRKQTQRLQDWDKAYVWHPFTQMQDFADETPLIIEEGKDIYLYDVEGKKYIDGVSSLWVNVHGHCVPEIDKAIKGQVDKISHSTLLGLSNVPSIELAKALVDITPDKLTKVFYSDSGSTGAEIAVKMAYQYWQQKEGSATLKIKFAHLCNSYHGDTVGAVSVGGIDLFHKIYKNLLFDTVSIDIPDSYRYEGDSWEKACLKQLEKTIQQHSSELAGVIVEPLIQGAAGMLLLPDGYLTRLRELCDAHNILMIVDEVATGFGRTGQMFACDYENISPDLMVVAKGLTGGYLPLAATLATQNIYDSFLGEYGALKTFFHGHTYTGNPLACAAALASLKLFESNKLMSNVQELDLFLEKALKCFEDLEHVGDIRRRGLMIGIELVLDQNTKTPYDWEDKIGLKVILKAREKGLIIRPLGSVIVLMPPLVISKEELQTILDITYQSIQEITENSSSLLKGEGLW